MENFIVSARKYRPATFDTVVGQQSITNTLKNAIRTDHLAQAFLFCGPRGVGKTTCARILAKTINCFNPTPEIEACNECDSCKSFNEGASLNVYELDAASNNSVDDIRNLIDQVRFAPQIGSKKVYIIDEVHMLSTNAFNAFLKTLEEPPSHAIFILATTEKHKIIPTILSRCQIFDFNRIQIEDIAKHLAEIANKEGIESEAEALHIIAQKADGALRDALSIFDQIVSFSGKNISYQAVIDNLNILDYDYYFKATDYLLKSDISSSLLLFNEVIDNGFDGHHFIVGLAEHLRNLLVCQDAATIKLLEVGKRIGERYAEQAKDCSLKFLLQALQIANTCDIQYKSSKNQRLLVELGLMQVASINSLELAESEKKKAFINLPFKDSNSQKLKVKPEPKAEPKKEQAENDLGNQSIELEKEKTEDNSNKKIPRGSFNKVSSAISIKNFTEEKKEKQQEDNTTDSAEQEHHGSQDFTEEEFLTSWEELVKEIEKSGKEGSSMVISAMITRKPVLKEDYSIELQVDNLSQLEEVRQRRTDLHEFLRKKLKNSNIELKLNVLKDKKQKKAYTQEEKFKKMAEKNPYLLELKKKLDLDFF